MKKVKTLTNDTESLLIFGIIIILTIIIAHFANKYLQKKLQKKAVEQNIDITNYMFIKHVLTVIIYFFGFGWALLSLPISESFAHSLFAGAGASTIILGFAAQEILGNAMSGIFLIFKKSFKINDVIEIKEYKGKVIEINLHDTILEDEERNIITVPNSLFSNEILKNHKQ
jgi:small conductance mechanosensitive channel